MLSESSQQNPILKKIEAFVIEKFTAVEAGHDLSHIERVYTNALKINDAEKADSFMVEAAILLHDICDEKLFDSLQAEKDAIQFLKSIHLDDITIGKLFEIIHSVSFGNSIGHKQLLTLEQKIVRDADRLDAIGAIGIARTFHYGGHKNRALFDKNIPPVHYTNKEAYRNNTNPTINHFYEKLLLLKDQMETNTGKQMAEQRHKFMLLYLEQFYNELVFEGFELLNQ